MENADQVEKYRKEGSSLFEYMPDQKAYVHVYKNARLEGASLKRLVAAYQNELMEDGEI